MIQKIKKPLSELNFGLMGFRSHLIEPNLSNSNLKYNIKTMYICLKIEEFFI